MGWTFLWSIYCRRQWSGARRSRSCAKRAAKVVRRKWLWHQENVRRVGSSPELVPNVLRTDAPAKLLEDVIATQDRYFLFVLFFAVFLESMRVLWDTAWKWLAGVQALRSAAEQRSGPSQTAWAAGSVGWWAGGPQAGWQAASAIRSRRRSVAGDRRGRLELASSRQA